MLRQEQSRLIDLGDDWTIPEPVVTPSQRRVSRRWWLLLVAAVVLALGAPVPAPPQAVLLFSFENGPRSYSVGPADGIVVVADETQITAFQVRGGRQVWHQAATETIEYVTVAPAAQVVLSTLIDTNTLGGPAPTLATLQARDLRTGRVLWQTDSTWSALDLTSDVMLMNDTSNGQSRIWGVDVRTGTVLWSKSLAADEGIFTAYSADGSVPDLVYLAKPDGTVRTVIVSTGAVTQTGTLPALVGLSTDRPVSVSIVGDVLLVTSYAQSNPSISAYDVTTLAPLWSQEPGQGTPDYLSDCGPVLCGQGDGTPLMGYDRRTGRQVWSIDAQFSLPLAGGLMLVTKDNASPVRVVQAADLRERGDLGDWRPVTDSAGNFAIRVFTAPDADGTWFGLFDPKTLEIHPFLRLRGEFVESCTTSDHVLACQTSANKWRFWSYP